MVKPKILYTFYESFLKQKEIRERKTDTRKIKHSSLCIFTFFSSFFTTFADGQLSVRNLLNSLTVPFFLIHLSKGN